MLARAAAELWLLYGAHQWQYRYGIAHDLLSASLLLIGARYARNPPQRQPENPNQPIPTEIRHMHIIAAMFLCEALFAYYIAHFNTSPAHARLWFINWQRAHLPNLIFTLLSEAILLKWLYRIDQWLNRHD